MTYTGHMENGVVIFDGPARPPEGAVVRVEEIAAAEQAPTWGEVFNDLIGAADGLPADFADNHDHYIHGTPKRQSSGG